MFGLQVIVQMEWQYQPEHRTGTPDEDCLSEAGGELWMISVPRQVSVPEGNIPAQACKRGGIILLHIVITLLKNFSVHFISKIFLSFYVSKSYFSTLLSYLLSCGELCSARKGRKSTCVCDSLSLQRLLTDRSTFRTCLLLHHGVVWKREISYVKYNCWKLQDLLS